VHTAPGPHVDAAGDQPAVQAVDQGADAEGRGVEDGSGRRLRAAPQAEQEAALLACDRRQLGHRGGEAEVVGVAGVDAADQRVDEPFQHLPPKAGTHQRAERVVGDRRARQHGVECGARLSAGRQQPRAAQSHQPLRHAEHQAGGDRVQRAAVEHEGTDGLG
jgi:hypothetical protein